MRSNLADLVREAAERRPAHPALVSASRNLTWSELDSEIDAVAAALQGCGVAKGDRVVIVLGNQPEFVTAYFGTLRAGAVAVPMNPGLTEHELQYMLADAAPALAIVNGSGQLTVAAAAPQLRLVLVGGTGAGGGAEPYSSLVVAGATPTAVPAAPDDLALLLYTSGTSGRARAAMLTHRALLANVTNVAAVETPSMRPDDVVLLVLPLFHVYALNGTLAAAADQAATVVLEERFDPDETLALIRRQGITNVPGAPPMFTAWSARSDLREAFASVRLLFTGAAPMNPAALEAIVEACGLPVFEGYGLTEAAPGVSSTLVDGRAKPGTVGRPFPGVEVRLRNEDGSEAEEGDPGEIWIRGANLFSGYWPDGADGPDADGWYATGDVAYFDDDNDLVLVDRRRELVIVNGFNVYPREVEEAIGEQEGIAEIAVIGIPDEHTGEAVRAYVVAREGSGLTADDVKAFAVHRLARFKCPTEVVMVDSLPHSATGKVAKGRLRELG